LKVSLKNTQRENAQRRPDKRRGKEKHRANLGGTEAHHKKSVKDRKGKEKDPESARSCVYCTGGRKTLGIKTASVSKRKVRGKTEKEYRWGGRPICGEK